MFHLDKRQQLFLSRQNCSLSPSVCSAVCGWPKPHARPGRGTIMHLISLFLFRLLDGDIVPALPQKGPGLQGNPALLPSLPHVGLDLILEAPSAPPQQQGSLLFPAVS